MDLSVDLAGIFTDLQDLSDLGPISAISSPLLPDLPLTRRPPSLQACASHPRALITGTIAARSYQSDLPSLGHERRACAEMVSAAPVSPHCPCSRHDPRPLQPCKVVGVRGKCVLAAMASAKEWWGGDGFWCECGEGTGGRRAVVCRLGALTVC